MRNRLKKSANFFLQLVRIILKKLADFLNKASTPTQLLFWIMLGPGLLCALPFYAVHALDNQGFESNFWANYLSTVLGLIVGIPLALWLNGVNNEAAEKKAAVEHRSQIIKLFGPLIQSISKNQLELQRLQSIFSQQNTFAPETDLDTSSWNLLSASSQIQFLDDPVLYIKLSKHFAGLAQLSTQSAAYYSAAGRKSPFRRSPERLQELELERQEILKRIEVFSTEAQVILARLVGKMT